MTSSAKVTTCVINPRDLQILLDLYTSRYMTAVQIQALHWRLTEYDHSGQQRACQRRLQKLFEVGLVRRIEPLVRYSGKQPTIYAVAKGGAQLLTEQYGIAPHTIAYKPHSREENYPFLQHLLDTTDIRIALTYAAQRVGVQLETWRNELELRSEGMADVISLTDPDGKQHKAAVVPDAVAVINRAGKRAIFLLEIDRGTVVLDPTAWAKRGWARKVRTYTTYFESDAYKQRYGEHTAQVVTITTGPERMAHMKEATENAGGGKCFWFSTSTLAKDPDKLLTASIWTRASLDGAHSLLR